MLNRLRLGLVGLLLTTSLVVKAEDTSGRDLGRAAGGFLSGVIKRDTTYGKFVGAAADIATNTINNTGERENSAAGASTVTQQMRVPGQQESAYEQPKTVKLYTFKFLGEKLDRKNIELTDTFGLGDNIGILGEVDSGERGDQLKLLLLDNSGKRINGGETRKVMDKTVYPGKKERIANIYTITPIWSSFQPVTVEFYMNGERLKKRELYIEY
jgi:hypothetical protein